MEQDFPAFQEASTAKQQMIVAKWEEFLKKTLIIQFLQVNYTLNTTCLFLVTYHSFSTNQLNPTIGIIMF